MKKSMIVYLLAMLLAACATGPIIDDQGVDMVQYEKDLADCERIARQVGTGKQTAKSGAVGAVVGGAMGAVFGDAGEGAAVGAIEGGTAGGLDADHEKSRVVKNCLDNRGYTVLN
jgi:hypothetical protein